MNRVALLVVALTAISGAVACVYEPPLEPGEPNEEADELREMVAKAIVRSEEERAEQGMQDGELLDAELDDDVEEAFELAMSGAVVEFDADARETMVRVAMVRCPPQMILERTREGGVLVVVAAGRTRGVIDDER